MKKYVLLILLSIPSFAQDLPISESNYFVFDKYNYGVSLNNIANTIFQQKNGEVLVSEYSGHIYKINNTSVAKAISGLKAKNPILQGYFKLKNGLEYYCTSSVLFITKNSRLIKRITINSQNAFSTCFSLYKNQIYFVTYYNPKQFFLRKFDGSVVKNVIQLPDNPNTYTNSLFINHQINIVTNDTNTLTISKLENNKLIPIKNYKISDITFTINWFLDENNFSGYTFHTLKDKIFFCKNGKINYFDIGGSAKVPIQGKYYVMSDYMNNNIQELKETGIETLFNTTFNSSQFITQKNEETNSYYVATGTNLLRYFPHITKYPRLFNKSNSTAVFLLVQANDGKIWTGSYQGFLSTINKKRIQQSAINEFMFMNGGLAYKDKMLLFAESQKGALLFSNENEYKKIADSTAFYHAYLSKNNKIYLGSSGKGLWFTDVKNLDQNKSIKWNSIDEKKGLSLFNIITICEDKFGNIWMGRSSQGIAVYNPTTKKTKTWQIDKKEIDFGSMATVLDDANTLWFGKSNGGLCYYDGKNGNDYQVINFKTIDHPLLKSDFPISFIKQWNDYLILGANDKILLFNLKKWYQKKAVSVRYLNAQETNFSAPTEQNTCLVDKRDESVWFATSDMLYQWNIKKWLSLPAFKVSPHIIITKDSIQNSYVTQQNINFKPTENSFDVEIGYQTKDNLPRYLNGILVRKGEKPIFENPNLQTKFHFANVSSGDYIFFVRVCQQDGSYSIFEYPLHIDSFLWQKWWFWLMVSLVPIGFTIYYFKKKNEIEQTKKKLSQLSLSSLSNQFRPHFMLNALNSIGSQMEDKPHAEKVISRLGESINILYGFSQKNDFTHSVKNEWKLVENIIEIQKLLFIPELETSIELSGLIKEDYKVPVGILQIPIENALLHGLRNRLTKPYLLEIKITEDDENHYITIKDNGVGRQKAAEINNFKKNGNGLKTVFEMIRIINNSQPNSVLFEIIDLDNDSGTIVKLALNKSINYDKIKI